MRKVITLSPVLLFFGACNYSAPEAAALPPSAPFSRADIARYSASGSGSISGQAFLRQKGGGVVTCAGSQVLLIPDVPYFSESMTTVQTGHLVVRTDQGTWEDVSKMGRKSSCDAQGNFIFTGLPNVTWIVVTRVAWDVGSVPQGGPVIRSDVKSTSGQETKVLLNDSDLAGGTSAWRL